MSATTTSNIFADKSETQLYIWGWSGNVCGLTHYKQLVVGCFNTIDHALDGVSANDIQRASCVPADDLPAVLNGLVVSELMERRRGPGSKTVYTLTPRGWNMHTRLGPALHAIHALRDKLREVMA